MPGAKASEPAIGGVVMVARMPMLFDEEVLDRKWAFVNRKIAQARQRRADVARQGRDKIAVGQNGRETQKSRQSQRDPAPDVLFMNSLLQQRLASTGNDADVVGLLIAGERESMPKAGMIAAR